MIGHARIAVQPGMDPGQVIAFEVILDRVFPVGGKLIASPAAMAQQAEIIGLPAIGQRLQPARQRRGIARQIDEQQSSPAFQAHGAQSQLASLDAFALMDILAADMGRADQPAVEIVGPGMIGAGDGGAAAEGFARQQRIAMAADIVEGLDIAGAVAQQDQRAAGDLHRPAIAGPRQLIGPSGINPAGRKQQVLFLLQELRTGIGDGGQAHGLGDGPLHGLDRLGRQNGLDAGGHRLARLTLPRLSTCAQAT